MGLFSKDVAPDAVDLIAEAPVVVVGPTPAQALASELRDPGRLVHSNPGGSGHSYYLSDSVIADFLLANP